MTIRSFALVLSVVVTSLVGCGAAPDTEQPGSQQENLAGGCHEVCPKCPANQVCPMIACYVECNANDGGGNTCVDTQMCAIGYTWSTSACACVPSKK